MRDPSLPDSERLKYLQLAFFAGHDASAGFGISSRVNASQPRGWRRRRSNVGAAACRCSTCSRARRLQAARDAHDLRENSRSRYVVTIADAATPSSPSSPGGGRALVEWMRTFRRGIMTAFFWCRRLSGG